MAHDHSHQPMNVNRNFQIAVGLNVVIVVLQVSYGFLSNSIALIADAGHNLTDVLSLLFALGANILAARPPTKKRTYGYRRTTILAALLNAVILLVTTGAILYGAIERLRHPIPVDGSTVSVVAAISIVLNAASAWLFSKGRKDDLNIRAAFLHMAGDAGVSAGVVAAGLIIFWGGVLWVDPLMSIIISFIILMSTWKLLRESFNLAADAVPEQIDSAAIEAYLQNIAGVTGFHDLHIWGMSTTHAVLTVHLVIPERAVEDDLLFTIARNLHDNYGIEHTTIQVERGGISCELAGSHVI